MKFQGRAWLQPYMCNPTYVFMWLLVYLSHCLQVVGFLLPRDSCFPGLPCTTIGTVSWSEVQVENQLTYRHYYHCSACFIDEISMPSWAPAIHVYFHLRFHVAPGQSITLSPSSWLFLARRFLVSWASLASLHDDRNCIMVQAEN